MNNILEKIILKKREVLKITKKEISEDRLLNNVKNINNFINFKEVLQERNSNKKISIIGEIKKSSPSAGEIVKDFDPLSIAKIYIENNVPCISVLTEENFFYGKLNYMENIKKNYKIPILCKDFFIDTYQVPLAKSYGADCILIILSAVDKKLAIDLYQAANDLNISTLIEVHSKEEAENALSFEKSLIGINNRNLKNLSISLNTSVELSKILSPHKNPLIAESGISTEEDVKFIVKKLKFIIF